MRSGNGAPEEFGKPRHNQAPDYGPGETGVEAPAWVIEAIGEGLGKVVSVYPEPGHEGSFDRLVVEMNVEIPLEYQTSRRFKKGSISFETVTEATVRVKFSEDMRTVFTIELISDEFNVRITQDFIDKRGEDLKELAHAVRGAFFDKIGEQRLE